ncbi:Mut7-C RNAse domain-containing protein [Halomicroarcula sp. GCM10025709]|uniref:Mut7-C RNAse domain-containing protein n=1 Tax=Haloarcula TaxID=2237 RepID=UPI0024C4004D|nr:Mut7-C RNAse domain-containing protein [Halomicroarcula sp. YJ-61-S]
MTESTSDDGSENAHHHELDREPLVLDAMLGTLATYLRMCGYDAAYALDRDAEADEALLALAHTEARRLVTRDADLAAETPDRVLLTERSVEGQLRELADEGFVLELADPPTYCGTCNGRLEPVDRTEPTPEYAPDPDDETLWRCRDCGQHFWKGSHWDDVAATLASL